MLRGQMSGFAPYGDNAFCRAPVAPQGMAYGESGGDGRHDIVDCVLYPKDVPNHGSCNGLIFGEQNGGSLKDNLTL